MKMIPYYMALEVTPKFSPPMASTISHIGEALSGCLLGGIELIKDRLQGEGAGKRKRTLGAGEMAPR